jgi:enhancer of mRNA-decapping protein 4
VNESTSVLVTGDQVKIVPSSGKHSMGSSKVKLKNVVDYSWEYKFYDGQILAIHISGAYIAYGLQGKFII